MDVEVVIPSKSIPSAIDRDLLNNEIPLALADLEAALVEVVRSSFEGNFAANAALFRDFALPRRVVIELQDDLGDARPSTLATYDPYRSATGDEAYFTVSAHLAYPQLLAGHGLASPAYPLSREHWWAHELVHLRDQEVLGRSARTSARGEEVPLAMGSLSLREWELLVTLGEFRHEGLAVLYEHLVGERGLALSGEEARKLFGDVVEQVVPIALRPAGALEQAFDWNAANKVLKRAHAAAYDAGAYATLDALRSSHLRRGHGTLVRLFGRAVAAMTAQKAPNFTREEAAAVVGVGLDLDVASFLEALGDTGAEHPWGLFLDLPALSSAVRFLSSEGEDTDTRLFARVLAAVARSDSALLVRVLLDEIGYPMDVDELVRERAAWSERRRERDREGRSAACDDEIAAHIDRLMKVVTAHSGCPEHGDRAALATAALTYAFDPEDYIDDAAELGLLDDLYVLRAAVAFVG